MKVSRRTALGSLGLLAGASVSSHAQAGLGEHLLAPFEGLEDFWLAGHLPPVEGFWSITLYNAQYFFVANPLDRYSISPRQNLRRNEDGSVDIYIQKDPPGADDESNWLPAPDGRLILMLRMYWPNEGDPSILDGSWTPPAVKVAS